MVDEREILPNTAIKSATLEGEAEAAYVERLYRILRGARLNLYYPDSRKLQTHVRCMSPQVHRGLYDGIAINLDSGLPTYREWTRVQTDVSIADEQLHKLGARRELERKARRSDEPIHQKLLKKHQYYSDIRGKELSPLGNMDVALRRVEHEKNTAYFHVVLDKLDASGLFVRYSIDLAQTSGAWNKQVVRLDEETAEHTEEFQSLIYKFTSLDSEFTFAKLAGLGGLSVERVAKGTVGPIYLAREQAPAALSHLFDGDDAFVAMFALDMVANDIAEDRDNDPLDVAMTEKMSPEAKQTFHTARERLGVRTFRDRKFVVPRRMVPAVREFCEAQGTKNIVYGV
ncbi:hypothetical protein FIV42_19220 [Persicimonas caeni]|uniref:Uncharacterized protein n=1 Tax=Persicimonas caeni TaxID=2292766 RepID=A0A4Y6PWW2_PERCE|nr:hypothetical protein [Persicimonas caeni]QDG52796.1 hypothetical protein FIV42_19220 [Persicimonas caeni]QED34018.1 hypothetical protein FRD00_19215 [Persicimonas caeni]